MLWTNYNTYAIISNVLFFFNQEVREVGSYVPWFPTREIPVMWTFEVHPGMEAKIVYTDDPKNPYEGLIGHLVFLCYPFDNEEHKCVWVQIWDDLPIPELHWFMQQDLDKRVVRRKMIRLKDYDVRRPNRTRSQKPPKVGRLYKRI